MAQRALLTIGLFILFAPGAAWACACSKAPPGACPGLDKDDTVFLGTVTEIETVSPQSTANAESTPGSTNDATPATTGSNLSTTPITRYHFRIDEKFAGADAAEMDVFSGGDDGDCGYRFQKGDPYIVFTQQETEGRLFATICSGTRPVSEGRALLPQLRAMRNGQRVASVFGVLRRADPPFLAPPGDPDDPLPSIALKLRSRDDRFSTSTGPDGVYSFYDVHAGEYRFTANLPVRMELTQKTLSGGLPPFKIPNGACYEYDVDALPTGHIRGSVLGPDGKPLQLASVELYRAGQYADSLPGLWGFQGSKGVFDFDHVGPGEYTLVYNRMNRMDPNSPFPRAFYPGVADLDDSQPILLKDGQQLSKANVTVQEGYPVRPLRVTVKWEHGKLPGNVTIMAKAGDGGNPAANRIAGDSFEFMLLQSGHYMISAWEDLDPQSGPKPRRGESCNFPARIETPAIDLDASDASIKGLTLVFPAIHCTNP